MLPWRPKSYRPCYHYDRILRVLIPHYWLVCAENAQVRITTLLLSLWWSLVGEHSSIMAHLCRGSTLWILMAWCFSTRASVATVLSVHPCLSSCWWVKLWFCIMQNIPNRTFQIYVYNSCLLSGEPDYFGRNKILSGYDLSHYQVPYCIRVFFYFVWFVFIHHNFQFYFKLCTYCNILDIYLS